MVVVRQRIEQSHQAKYIRSRDEVAEALAIEMKRVTAVNKCTKRTAVRLAIKNVIRSDILMPGDLLPSEKELTGILGVSLGTVQAALGQLKSLGAITRRRGDGSRVSDQEPFDEATWHFRFLSKRELVPLRIMDEKIKIETTSRTGVWSDYLGRSDKYLRIWRRVTMRDGTVAGAEVFLEHSVASALASIDENELRMANIRPYLEETLGLAIKGASHSVRTIQMNASTAAHYDLPLIGEYFEIHAKAYTSDGQPVYFQRIFVSASDCILEFS